jgi:hypothetical protein
LPLSQPQLEKRFPCERCERTFTTKSGRTNHSKICNKKNKETILLQVPTAKLAVTSKESDINTDIIALSPVNAINSTIPIWGSLTREDLTQVVGAVYEEVVHWRKNLFLVPSGAAGKKYVRESAKIIDYFNTNSKDFGDISIKLLMIMPLLLLQKPS